jgi:sulfate adenylyltransferase subunit 1
MVTGASNVKVSLILVDARQGLVEQTARHLSIAAMLRIPKVIICINKMDLVQYQEATFESIKESLTELVAQTTFEGQEVSFLPISSLYGQNITTKAEQMPWFTGNTLLGELEAFEYAETLAHAPARFPVQFVVRPMTEAYHDFRGYAGRVAGGVFKPGDEVTVLPSGFKTRVKAIHSPDGEKAEAFAPQSVCITLTEEIDISRGDTLVKTNNPPQVSQDIEAMICWFSNKPMPPRAKLVLRHTTQETKAIIQDVKYHVDINTLHKIEGVDSFSMNDIGRISLRTAGPLIHDSYRRNRITGSFILIDPGTNETVAAGMII